MTRTTKSFSAHNRADDPGEPVLTASELPGVQALLAIQNLLGQGTPAFTASSVLELMKQLDTLSDTYPQLANPSVKGWVDQLYDLLAAADTSYGQKFPALYLTWQVSQFQFKPASETITVPSLGLLTVSLGVQTSSPDWDSYPNSIQVGAQAYPLGYYGNGVYPAFHSPCRINYALELHSITIGFGSTVIQGSTREPWTPTANPPVWNQALTTLLNGWGAAKCPPNVFPPRAAFTDYVQQHLAVLDPKSWTDVEQLKDSVAEVWQSQLAEMNQLLVASTLSSETYFYLLHLLIALRSGDEDSLALAARTLTSPCGSTEYPNDNFASQLVYAALMNVSDPNGAFVWSNPQLLELLHDLRALVAGEDPASGALQRSLDAHINLLKTDAAYPMQDPNVPDIPFDQRKTDTLAALDKSRQALNQGTSQ